MFETQLISKNEKENLRLEFKNRQCSNNRKGDTALEKRGEVRGDVELLFWVRVGMQFWQSGIGKIKAVLAAFWVLLIWKQWRNALTCVAKWSKKLCYCALWHWVALLNANWDAILTICKWWNQSCPYWFLSVPDLETVMKCFDLCYKMKSKIVLLRALTLSCSSQCELECDFGNLETAKSKLSLLLFECS